MFKVNLYTKVMPGDAKKAKKYLGYILSCVGREEKENVEEIVVLEDATYHEANLRAIVCALRRLNQSCEVHIYSEDRFVMSMIENNLSKWQQNDFYTTRGTKVENEEEWREYWRLSRGQLIRLHVGEHEYTERIMEDIKRRYT